MNKKTLLLTSTTLAVTLGLSACNPRNSASSTIITTNGTEPKKPLISTDTGETGGGKIINLISEGLYTYDASGKLINGGIEKWDTSDNQNITVTLADKMFDNGAKITAKDYVDTWNYAASAKNGQYAADYFRDIQGYDANNKEQTSLSGLKVIDDKTFTITLNNPIVGYNNRLADSAFRPLPTQVLQDPSKYGNAPIGNGPYKVKDANAWQHNTEIQLVKNTNYHGPHEAKNDGVTIKFYQDLNAAYNDVQAGNLDVLDQVPSQQIKTYTQDFKDRNINKAVASNMVLAVPNYVQHFSGEEGKLRRQALSLATNRNELTEKIFNNTKKAAHTFSPGMLSGSTPSLDGSDLTEFNVEKAKELWKQADAISAFSGELTLSYNNDASNKEWVDAVANMWKNNLGINSVGQAFPDYKSFGEAREAKKFTGPFVRPWQADYASMYNFVQPLFDSQGMSNYSGYSNPQVDQLLKESMTVSTEQESENKVNQAQSLLLKDMAAIPLWNNKAQTIWSERVQNVQQDWRGVPIVSEVTVK